MSDKKVLKSVAEANKKFREILTSKGASTEELSAYQERLSTIARNKYLRTAPVTKREEIEFSRLLYKQEPYISGACELLIEAGESDRVFITRRKTIADKPEEGQEPTEEDKKPDVLVQFLNWYLNEYIFDDTFTFMDLWNTQWIDWFVAGEELYFVDKLQTDEKEIDGNTIKFPTAIVPISPELIESGTQKDAGFGFARRPVRVKVPRETLAELRENDPNFNVFEGSDTTTLDKEGTVFVKRMARMTDIRGKALVEAAHEPVRVKYTNVARDMTKGRTDLVNNVTFIKYGETGEDGIERSPEEMALLAQEIKNNIDAGLALVVVPPDLELETTGRRGSTDGDIEDKDVHNQDILAGMRMFGIFINGNGSLPAGLKETPLTVIRASVNRARTNRIKQLMPRLVGIIYEMNKSLFEGLEITKESLLYTFSEIGLQSLEAIQVKLRVWEDGLLSSEDFHGSEYSTILANKRRELAEEPNTFLPRQLSHTLSGNPQEEPTDEEPTEEPPEESVEEDEPES